MRLVLFSDIHGNLEALEVVLKKAKEIGYDEIIFLGDIIGYGPNPKECLGVMLDETRNFIMGNHDYSVVDYSVTYDFNNLARESIKFHLTILSDEDKNVIKGFPLSLNFYEISFVHSNFRNPLSWEYILHEEQASGEFSYFHSPLAFFGHTHIPMVYEYDAREKKLYSFYLKEGRFSLNDSRRYLINPGSVGQPRDRDPRASFCLFDLKGRYIEIFRLIYQVEKTREKIIHLGLPKFLGDRLLLGI